MSHEQAETEEPSEPTELEPATGSRWGDPIPSERAAELRELADRQRTWVDSAPDDQRDLDQSVFKDIRLTGADVFWLATYALAGPEETSTGRIWI